MATLRKQLKIRWKRPPTAYWSGFLRWRAFLIPCKIAELCANIVHASPFLFFPGKLRMRWCCHRKRVPPSKSLTSIWGIYSVVVESVCLCSVQWLSTAIDWAANPMLLHILCYVTLFCWLSMIPMLTRSSGQREQSTGANPIQVVEVTRKLTQLTFWQLIVGL